MVKILWCNNCSSSQINDKTNYISIHDSPSNNHNNISKDIKGGYKMVRRKKSFHLIAGVLLGVFLAYIFKIYSTRHTNYSNTQPTSHPMGINSGGCSFTSKNVVPYINQFNTSDADPFRIVGMNEDETTHNSKKNLLFVGVMTAEKYLTSRATAVYKTWGKEVPGRIAFFSSEVSKSKTLPLVALKGVDDSYPPQKKSFMMLLYMHDHFIDKFEWFLRADDDVFVRTDKLEILLRSVDSRRPQFIGQAGRGNNQEFGFLSLEYDENFCMGGPGIIMSRETLVRIAPHIKECLKNLYTTHEDVEIGRCVKKYAGVPCTWSYEMQSILYHNSSGSLAFTGNLKRREVHQAITMHPVKDHRNMHRIHTYVKNLKIQELKERAMSLHRDIHTASTQLHIPSHQLPGYILAEELPLFTFSQGQPNYLGDTSILGVTPNLIRYQPRELKNVITWEFFSKVVFSPVNANPKRKMENFLKEGLEDIIRELMESINSYSKQRGRIIDFQNIIYGYQRLDPVHGIDYILDVLLVYKKYRGRKMTAQVRRHAYLQQSFTGIEIREVPLGEMPVWKSEYEETKKKEINYDTDNMYPNEDMESSPNNIPFLNFKKLNAPIRDAINSGMKKLTESLPMVFTNSLFTSENVKVINFILPLSGRFDIFIRFMKNYEEICLIHDKRTTLYISLFRSVSDPDDYDKTVELISLYENKYPYSKFTVIPIEDVQFSRSHGLEKGVSLCDNDDLLFFIDVDIVFTSESLQRIRLNTIKHNRVYFPIVFSQYDPQTINSEQYNKINNINGDAIVDVSSDLKWSAINSESDYKTFLSNHNTRNDDFGYFREFGFGLAGFYKCDFSLVGGFNIDIKGWGLEDVHLYEKFVKSNLTIFRSVDIDLVHMFHPVECDKDLEASQYTMCIGSKASTFGSNKHMTIFAINHPNILNIKQIDSNNNNKQR